MANVYTTLIKAINIIITRTRALLLKATNSISIKAPLLKATNNIGIRTRALLLKAIDVTITKAALKKDLIVDAIKKILNFKGFLKFETI